MQNRIEELARKARALSTTKDAFEEYVVYFDAEKFEQVFAELLIKECIKIANRAVCDEREVRCIDDVINEHFGIKD